MVAYFTLAVSFLFTFVAHAEMLTLPLPKVEAPNVSLKAAHRDSALYMLSTYAPELTESVSENDTELRLVSENLPAEVVIALQNSREVEGTFNYLRFRTLLGPFYLKNRRLQHENFFVPETLDEFLKQTSYKSWSSEMVTKSRVKGLSRHIYRSPPEWDVQIRVAETLESVDGDVNAPVRETELLIRRKRDPKNWDFFAYDGSGKLSTQSTFRNGPMPSPAVCMACHYSPQDRAYVPVLQ